MYKRILVAVDGSELSQLAVMQAARLAQSCRAIVQALYVVDSTDIYYGIGPYDPGGVTEALLTYGEAVLQDAAASLAGAGVEHCTKLRKTSVAPGRVAATIELEAQEWNADLIVMGTHGRRGMQRLLMGSVAQGVVHRSTRPVLLVRHSAQRADKSEPATVSTSNDAH